MTSHALTTPATPAAGDAEPVDLVVVGAGIVGLAHAFVAAESGLRVVVVDRDARPNGASIRNFGHACITAQHGELAAVAQAARPWWLRAAAAAGFWAVEAGAVAVARSSAQLAVLHEFAGERDQYVAAHGNGPQVRLLDRDEVRDYLGLGADSAAGIRGGLYLADDLRVNPREAAPRLADHLAARPGVEVQWRSQALGHRRVGDRVLLDTTRGTVAARALVYAVGHDVDQLFPAIAETFDVRRCALQMRRTGPLAERRVTPAVLTGSSLLRYDGFSRQPSAAQVRDELDQNNPALMAVDPNAMFTQLPDASLLVGDTHVTDVTVAPFIEPAKNDTIALELGGLLEGADTTAETWQGVYAKSRMQDVLDVEVGEDRAHSESGAAAPVRLVSVTTGLGMTLAFGLADRTIAALGSRLGAHAG